MSQTIVCIINTNYGEIVKQSKMILKIDENKSIIDEIDSVLYDNQSIHKIYKNVKYTSEGMEATRVKI